MCLKYQQNRRKVTEETTCIIMSPTLSSKRSAATLFSPTQSGVLSGPQPLKWLADSICEFNLCHSVVHELRFLCDCVVLHIRPTRWMRVKQPSDIQPTSSSSSSSVLVKSWHLPFQDSKKPSNSLGNLFILFLLFIALLYFYLFMPRLAVSSREV